MDKIGTNNISPQLLSRREVRLQKLQDLYEVAEKTINTITLLSPEKQKELNSFYNSLLCDIYKLKEISFVSSTPMKDISTKDKEEIIYKKVERPDGTVSHLWENQATGQIKSFTAWKDGTEVLRTHKTNVSINQQSIIPDYNRKIFEDFFNHLIESNPQSPDLNHDYIIEHADYVNSPDISTLFQEENYIQNAEIADEMLMSGNNIKKRERLYNNGFLELIINCPLYKQKVMSDLDKTFEFSHKIYNDDKEKKSLYYNDGTFVENNIDYGKGEKELTVKFKEFLLKDRASKEGRLTELAYNGEKSRKVLTGQNKMSMEYKDGTDTIKKQISEEKALFLSWKKEGIKENSLTLFPCGSGRKRDIDDAGNIKEFSWTPDREIMYLEEKFSRDQIKKSYFYGNGITRRITSYSDGNSVDLLKYPDNTTKMIYSYKDGAREAVTLFPHGEKRRTVRYPDGSMISDLKYRDNSMKSGKLFSDGTVSLMKNWRNGIKQETICWPLLHKGQVDTVFPSGERDIKIIYRDGSCKHELYTKDGKESINIPGKYYLNNINKFPLFNRLLSHVEQMKLLKNPFHNLLLTVNPELWVLALIGGPSSDMSLKTHRKIDEPVYVEFTVRFEILEGNK